MESRLKKYFPMIRTRKEVMQCIFEQKTLREQFENWGEEAQEEY